jgi:hypothetical protein
MKYHWLTFPILGDIELGQRVANRLEELGWTFLGGIEASGINCGYSCDLLASSGRMLYHGDRRKLQQMVDGVVSEPYHILGDFDLLLETDCYRYGSLDLEYEKPATKNGRRVVKSVPLF